MCVEHNKVSTNDICRQFHQNKQSRNSLPNKRQSCFNELLPIRNSRDGLPTLNLGVPTPSSLRGRRRGGFISVSVGNQLDMPEWEANSSLPSTRNQEVNEEDVRGDLYQHRPPPPPSPSTESSDGDASEGHDSNKASAKTIEESVLTSDHLHQDCPPLPPSPSTESSDGDADERDNNSKVTPKSSENLVLPPDQLHQHRPPPPSPSTESSDGDADEIEGNKRTSQISDERLEVAPSRLYQHRPPPPPSSSTESSDGDPYGDDSENVNQRSGERSAAPPVHFHQNRPPPPPSPSTDSSDRDADEGEGGKNARQRDGERPTASPGHHQCRPPPLSSPPTEFGNDANKGEDGKNAIQGSSGRPEAATSRRDFDSSKVWDNRDKDAEVNASKLLTQSLSADTQGLEAITAEPSSTTTAKVAVVSRLESAPVEAPASAVESSRPQQSTAETLQSRLASSTRKRGRSSILEPSGSDSAAPLPPPSPAPTQGSQNPSQVRKHGPNRNTRPFSEEDSQRTLGKRKASSGSSRQGNLSHEEEIAKLAGTERLSRMRSGAQPEPKRASSILVTPTVQADHIPVSNDCPRSDEEDVLGEITHPTGRTRSRKRTSFDSPEDIAVAALNALSSFTPPSPSPPFPPSEPAANGEVGVSSTRAPSSLARGRKENRNSGILFNENGTSAAGRSAPASFVNSSPLAARKTARVSEGRKGTASTRDANRASTAASRLLRSASVSFLLDAAPGAASALSSPRSSVAAASEGVSGKRAPGQLGEAITGSESVAYDGVAQREVSESSSISSSRGKRRGTAGGSGKGPTHKAPVKSVTMPSPLLRQAASPLVPSDATTGTASGRTAAPNGDMGDSCQRQGHSSESAQRRGRTSAQCSEAAEGGPSNKRARIQTSSPTSAPVSDKSSNVTGDCPRERGNGASDPTDSEPSTTYEEDLALVRKREADYEGLLAIHAMVVQEIVALQAEEDELRKLAGLPAVHPEFAPPLPSPVLPLVPPRLKQQKRAPLAKPNEVGAPARSREAGLPAEAPRLSPVNDTGPNESDDEMVGNEPPVSVFEGSSNVSISSRVPPARTSPGGSSGDRPRPSDEGDDNSNAKETLSDETDDANGDAQPKGETFKACPADGSPSLSLSDDDDPEKSNKSADTAVSLVSGHEVSSSNDVLGSLPSLLPVPVAGILDGSPVSISDGASFDMEGLLLGDSDEDKDDNGGGKSTQTMIGKEVLNSAVDPPSDRSLDSGRAIVGGRGTGAVRGRGQGGENALTTLGARGRGRYGRGSGVRPAPSRGGANRPRYVDLNATYKRHDSRGGRGRLGKRGGRRGSPSTIASNRARGSGRLGGRLT